jgi:DNA polymerase epsilon subunit 1
VFRNVTDLLTVRKDLLPLALRNSKKLDALDAYAEVVTATASVQIGFDIDDTWQNERERTAGRNADPKELITDIREYDVPYYLRVAIDQGM